MCAEREHTAAMYWRRHSKPSLEGVPVLIDLSITEMRAIRKLLVRDQVANVFQVPTDHSMTQTNKEILLEKLLIAIEGCACEARWIQ